MRPFLNVVVSRLTALRYAIFISLALGSSLIQSPASGQGIIAPPKTVFGTVNGITRPIPGATITICAASSVGAPCSPALANTVFSDAALTQPKSNPFTADANGNYQFAAAPGTYTVTETGTGFSGYSYQLQLPTSCTPVGSCATTAGANTFAQLQTFNAGITSLGPNTLNGATTLPNIVGPGAVTGKYTHAGEEDFSNFKSRGPSPWYDVTSDTYGAKCDGVTNDTTAFNNAISAANSAGGGEVTIPPGVTCIISGQLAMGQTIGVTLRAQSSSPAGLAFAPRPVGKPLLQFTGTASPLIDMRSTFADKITGLNLQYTNAAFTGFFIDLEHGGTACSGSPCDTARDEISHNSISGTSSATGAAALLYLDKANSNRVDFNDFGWAVNGIRGQATTCSTYSNANTISNNTFNGSGQSISNAEIQNPGGGWGIITNTLENFAPSPAFDIDSSTCAATGYYIAGNYVDDSPAAWAGTVFNSLGNGVAIFGNTASGGSGLNANLMSLNSGESGITFFANTIGNFAIGFVFNSSNQNDVRIWGNSLIGGQPITTWQTGAPQFGTVHNFNSGALNQYSVENFTGGANGPTGSPFSQTIASGTATMTTAAIAAGTCGTTVTVAAAGVATTDAINWAFNAAPVANPAELVVSTWPTSGNVNFQFCNPSAGSITPSASTLNWRVTR